MKNTTTHIKFFLLLGFLLCVSNSIADTDKFFSSINNLSNSHVNKIYQDKKGYIWICTENGLNVFNGYDFKTYYHRNSDSTSLMNNSVLTVMEDTKGNFWVGTTGGLQLFDRDKEKFQTIRFSYPHINDFSYVNSIIEDRKGNIWLSTSRAGAICIKANSNQPVYYLKTNSNICSDKIVTFFEDKFGNIWMGSLDNGISVLNLDNQTIINYQHDSENTATISSNNVFAISETPDGNILVGSINGGIDMYDFSTRNFKRNFIPSAQKIFTMLPDGATSLWIGTDGNGLKQYNWKTKLTHTYESELINIDIRRAKVHSIFKDQQGNIWVALFQKGVLMIPPKNKIFNNIGFNPFYPQKNIGGDCVLSVLEDYTGDLWIGTDGDGIYRLNRKREISQHYNKSKLPGNCVLTVYEDSKKRIWAGTYLQGMYLYDKNNDSFIKKSIFSEEKEVQVINLINGDVEGNLWIGTNEKGLCKYNPETNSTIWFKYDLMKTKNQILSNTIHTLLFGKNNLLWIGTSDAGLSCYNTKTKTFSDYTFENSKLSCNNIYAVKEDNAGNLWVGTKSGLNQLNQKNGKTICYTEQNGLCSSSVYGIEIDKNNNLWISTSSGLSFFNVNKKTFTNYFISDGLINNEFRRGAHFKSKTGELFFGGINGVSTFFPFKAQPVRSISNLVFTDLYVYNELVKPGDNKNRILKTVLNSTDQIKLAYDIKSFSIAFAALEYNNPDKVIYRVMMDGFDTEWSTITSTNHIATYTNLQPGKYIFRVKAQLPGMAESERKMSIIITPPILLSIWAKLIYFIAFTLLIRYMYNRIRIRLRKKKEDIQKQNENQIMLSKLQFFTDISHEIRTPLTLILTPIEKLIKETVDGKLKDTYKLINQNGHRILRLINQIMEMRRLDNGQVDLKTEETDVIHFIEEIISSFNDIAIERNINFSFTIINEPPKVWIDQDKIDKVIFNVLSNAFKYTEKDGKINVSLDKTDNDIIVKISDSGEGIPFELREMVFNRFYQVPNDRNTNKMGTGIGLHISRRLLEIHHGKIYIEDSTGKGSVFVITLPLNNAYLKATEMVSEHISKERDLASLTQPSLFINSNDNSRIQDKYNIQKSKPKLLIVEDDSEIRCYISDILRNDYQILNAENGLLGLELAIKELPDCIVTDIMMPVMDGIDLCKKIKMNEITCHIPVIILTAKTTVEQRVEGLGVGADSYIPKPFNIDHLKMRIYKLIELRKVMKEKFEGKLEIKTEDVDFKTNDELFLEKFESIVKEQINDLELSVESISNKIGISRSQLQRRLKQLTNQNPSDYIKTMRLRHAAWLLVNKNISISEVTYATGFSSLSHFSNSFKEFYGMTPTRYIEINVNKNQSISE